MEDRNMEKGFGELLREYRLKAGYSLRAFAKVINMQPSNLSFMESGKVNPPRASEALVKIANALGLTKGSKEGTNFFDLSAGEARIPADIRTDENIRNYLPIMLRTVANARLTKKQLEELIQMVKNSRKGKKIG